ncbi:MAG: hypothetical protein JKX68_05345 [Flavobacteriales bacterium]|nr:hypothetical protein [Flavobacteriales bacterium]
MKNILILTAILIITSCANNKEELPNPETPIVITGTPITYNNHTKKYFDNYCIACHAVGQTQSFWPLTTYTEVSAFTGSNELIQKRVLDFGNMPPSGSVSGFLTLAEKDTLQMWLDQGAPQ